MVFRLQTIFRPLSPLLPSAGPKALAFPPDQPDHNEFDRDLQRLPLVVCIARNMLGANPKQQVLPRPITRLPGKQGLDERIRNMQAAKEKRTYSLKGGEEVGVKELLDSGVVVEAAAADVVDDVDADEDVSVWKAILKLV